jgi:hypothetical protein
MVRLYRYLTSKWGEAESILVFDARQLDHPINLDLIHVPIWAADEDCEVTALNTLGMSEIEMKGADFFAELHLAYRGRLDKDESRRLAGFLANLAEYPFEHELKLDWWEIIRNVGTIPVYSGCRHVLLHPKFKNEGFDSIEDEDGLVKLLYVVPITPKERHIILKHGRTAFWDYVEKEQIELLADRHDETRWYEAGDME